MYRVRIIDYPPSSSSINDKIYRNFLKRCLYPSSYGYNYWKFVFLKSSILAFHFNKNHYSLTLEERYTIVPKNIQSFWRNETVESICKFHQAMVHHIHQGQCARMFITRNENLRWRFNDSRGWKTLLIHLESSNGVISCRYPLIRLHNWSRCYARLTNIHL